MKALEGPVVASEGWLYDDSAPTWTLVRRPTQEPPEPGVAVCTDETLLVLGGADWRAGHEPEDWTAGRTYATGLWAHPRS